MSAERLRLEASAWIPTEDIPTHVIHEQAVIACVLLDATTYDEVVGTLPEHFDLPLHQTIWRAVLALRAEGAPLSLPSVVGRLLDMTRSQGDMMGTLRGYLPGLLNAMPVPVGADYHAAKVRRYAQVRAIVRLAEAIVLSGADDLAAIDRATEMGTLAAGGAEVALRSQQELVAATLDAIDERREDAAKAQINTGIPSLSHINAFKPGKLIVLPARPESGKSLLAYQMAQYAASHGARTLFVSLEMDGLELTERVFSAEAHVPPHVLTQAELLSDRDWDALTHTAAEMAPRPLTVLDARDVTLETILSASRRLKALGGLEFVVIDYAQLLPLPNPERVQETTAYATISRRLKAAARELEVCFMALSQLNREGVGSKPQLENIANSDAFGRDADTVLMLWPNTQRGEDGWKDGMRHMVLDVRKNRNGPKKAIDLLFNPATLTMGEITYG